MAATARARTDGKIIAVTGSAGKTGTKDALGILLSAQAETHFSVASFNNHWGVPLTLARFSQSARFGIFEIGMNHAGEITPLVDMVRPHVAIVTTIAPVHLAHFSSTDDIADAKAEIFSGVKDGGSVIINGDLAKHQRLLTHAQRQGIKRIFTDLAPLIIVTCVSSILPCIQYRLMWRRRFSGVGIVIRSVAQVSIL